MSLTPAQAAALGHVRAAAQDARALAEKRLRAACPGGRAETSPDDLTAYVMGTARVTLNFHPDRLRPGDGRTVAEALAADGVYRSQYETGLSNGGRTAFPGGARDEWERGLFGGAYHRAGVRPDERPKYGALDLAGHTDGAAPRFGSCHVRLRTGVNARSTFCHGDSHLGPTDVGTSDAFASVLAALAEDGVPLHGAGPRGAKPAGADAGGRGHGRVLDGYVEAQVHGSVVLARDAEALVLDPSFRSTGTARLLASTGVPIEWHPGFVLAPHEVDAEFRGPVMVPLAEWVCGAHSTDGLIDARVLGQAAASLAREPARWARWGTPDESLQYVKQMWHVLVWSGRPDTRGAPGA